MFYYQFFIFLRKRSLFLGRIEQNVNFRLLSYEEFANSKTFFAELGTISYVLKN
ncbi:hypothetical protein D925_00107 [Enterococcus faecalis B83616-1]|nr:hypothetical protein D927_01964 [Enterococcus faecalis 02-MB-BW-10]EPH84055.1 hypothetical protein D925_00107 [Enterococcus faecalis B83616-1]